MARRDFRHVLLYRSGRETGHDRRGSFEAANETSAANGTGTAIQARASIFSFPFKPPRPSFLLFDKSWTYGYPFQGKELMMREWGWKGATSPPRRTPLEYLNLRCRQLDLRRGFFFFPFWPYRSEQGGVLRRGIGMRREPGWNVTLGKRGQRARGKRRGSCHAMASAPAYTLPAIFPGGRDSIKGPCLFTPGAVAPTRPVDSPGKERRQ